MIYVELLTSLLFLLTEDEPTEPAPQYHTKVSVSSGPYFPRKSGRQSSGWP
jgi:hypothetical protein